MNQRYVYPCETNDDPVVGPSPSANSLADSEPLAPTLPAVDSLASPDRALDRELGARLDQIRRPAPGAVGFAEWTAGEQTLATARAAYAAGDLAAAGERLDRAERSFVRAGSPVDATAVGLERAALAALERDTEMLDEIARRAKVRLLTDLPVGLRAALEVLISAIEKGVATPDLTAALAEYGHMVRTGTTVATRFERPERPIPLLLGAAAPGAKSIPETGDGEGSPE